MSEATISRTPGFEGEASLVMAYEAVVENGHIRAPAGMPDGMQVYIVVPAVRQRPASGTAEWHQPFEAFEAFVREHPAPAEVDALSDDELNAIVHEARVDLYAPQSRD